MSGNDLSKTGSVGNSPVSLGRFSYGFENMSIRQWGEGSSLSIGSFCSIASAVVVFLGGNHRVDWVTTFPFGHVFLDELGGQGILGNPYSNGDVVIGHDVWIGHGVSIMSGVTIGSGAVLAANSNIVKDVLPYEVVGGNPAKVIKKRFDDEIIDLLLQLRWWDLPVEVIKSVNVALSARPDAGLLRAWIQQYRTEA